MRWSLSHSQDPRARALADRHYNRQKVGSPRFVAPGSPLVLLAGDTAEAEALWVSLLQEEEYVDHDWPGAWVCSAFRNEGAFLSSDLIREAVACTRWRWPDVPAQGLITFVNPKKIRSSNPGFCFLRAGFRRAGETKKRKLVVLQLLPADMPPAAPPLGGQMDLELLAGEGGHHG
jgi:hypothetical protein